jgi:hypothetical protein
MIGYQRIVAIYAKFVMCGINYYNKDILRLSTLRGYATAVNTLFQLRGLKQPTDLSNPSNMPGIIINNRLPFDFCVLGGKGKATDQARRAQLLSAACCLPTIPSLQNDCLNNDRVTKAIDQGLNCRRTSSSHCQPLPPVPLPPLLLQPMPQQLSLLSLPRAQATRAKRKSATACRSCCRSRCQRRQKKMKGDATTLLAGTILLSTPLTKIAVRGRY